MFKKYYCVKQFDITDCGAACLATISKQYGSNIALTKIREIAGTDKEGTNALGLIKAANELGFRAKGVRLETQDLSDEIPLPAIAHVKVCGLFHYVVIHRITKKKITIADPAVGIVTKSLEEFKRDWTGVLILLKPDDSYQKQKEKKGLFGRFFHIILPHKKLVIQIVLVSLILTLFGLMQTYYFKILIDDVLTNLLKNTLQIITLGMMLLHLSRISIEVLRNYLLLYLSQNIDFKLIFNYYQHVIRLPLSFFDSRKVGEILSRINDAGKIRSAISHTTFSVIIDLFLVGVMGLMLFLQNRYLFLVTTVTLPFYTLIVWGFRQPYQQLNRQVMEKGAELSAYLVETVSGAATIKAFNNEYEVNLETEKRYINQIRSVFKTAKLNYLQGSLQGILSAAGDLLFMWIGAGQVMDGQISIGQLLTFSALSGAFIGPVKRLINLQFVLQEAYVAADRLGEILDLGIEDYNNDKKVDLKRINGEIVFKDVDFRYGTRDLVLKDVSFQVNSGEKVAIVGESGSGKTTIAKLILNFYLPEKGEILIDGYNLRDLSLESLRDRIGYIPQEVVLFSGTVFENIAFGKKDASLEEVIEAAKAACIHEYINELPLRYETMVGERGSTLSGGQRQRIGIARALIKNPDLLILDEATSNLDSITERAIRSTLDQVCKDKTTIIIAHRLSTIRHCDKIIVLDQKEVAEWGTHDELMRRRGKYYQLWEGQLLSPVQEEEKLA